MQRIEALEFDEPVLAAIEAAHGISFAEIEEVCLDRALLLRGRDGAYRLLGRTRAGRYLTVMLEERGVGVWAIRTARGMTGREWRRYQAEGEQTWRPRMSRPAPSVRTLRMRTRSSRSRSPDR